ncbi:MAG: hypothetical protein NTV89_04580 [Proteobacteria bacterium]|nr:hypothetical protein [Pseudomonadota bacterium]
MVPESEDNGGWHRPSFDNLTNPQVIEEHKQKAWLGPQSVNLNHHDYINNMIGLIQDFHERLIFPLTRRTFTILHDYYEYIDENTNPSGGNWEGDYRCFELRTNTGDNQTVYLSILGNFYTPDSDVVSRNQNSITILHDGTLTKGHAVKRAHVIEFMRSNAPHLIRNNKVLLGTLPCDRLITWQDAQEFILNCIEYSLLRDEFRRSLD